MSAVGKHRSLLLHVQVGHSMIGANLAQTCVYNPVTSARTPRLVILCTYASLLGHCKSLICRGMSLTLRKSLPPCIETRGEMGCCSSLWRARKVRPWSVKAIPTCCVVNSTYASNTRIFGQCLQHMCTQTHCNTVSRTFCIVCITA